MAATPAACGTAMDVPEAHAYDASDTLVHFPTLMLEAFRHGSSQLHAVLIVQWLLKSQAAPHGPFLYESTGRNAFGPGPPQAARMSTPGANMSTHFPMLLQGYIPARAHVQNTTSGRTDNADSPSVPESQEILLVMQPATVMQRWSCSQPSFVRRSSP